MRTPLGEGADLDQTVRGLHVGSRGEKEGGMVSVASATAEVGTFVYRKTRRSAQLDRRREVRWGWVPWSWVLWSLTS